MENMEFIESLVKRSRKAQEVVAGYTQEQVDAVARMFAKVVYDNADMLAKMAAEETRMGVYEHKIQKNLGKSRIIWHSMKGKKTVGIIETNEAEGLAIVAKPMGVIAAATPCTNPVVTPMCNAMFAIKGGNTIIIAPHPRGKKVAKKLAELYYAELDKMGVPRDVFIVIEEPSVELTTMLMAACDVSVATGGAAMVKSAYSSGKPSFGVGPGNVQGLMDVDINIPEAVEKMIASRIFDNGIICSGTQTIIAQRAKYDEIIAEFKKQGALYIDDPAQVAKFREAIFPGGIMNKDAVGQSVETIAKLAGVELPAGTKLIILKPEQYGSADVLSKEKMCPLMTAYAYDTWEQGVEIAYQNLIYEGAGHSMDIQSNNQAHIEYASVKLPVSRFLINQISATQNGGAFTNGLSPTTTLGCGSWGNNSISENLAYFHLYNKSRIAYVKPNWSQPTDEEIFG